MSKNGLQSERLRSSVELAEMTKSLASRARNEKSRAKQQVEKPRSKASESKRKKSDYPTDAKQLEASICGLREKFAAAEKKYRKTLYLTVGETVKIHSIVNRSAHWAEVVKSEIWINQPPEKPSLRWLLHEITQKSKDAVSLYARAVEALQSDGVPDDEIAHELNARGGFRTLTARGHPAVEKRERATSTTDEIEVPSARQYAQELNLLDVTHPLDDIGIEVIQLHVAWGAGRTVQGAKSNSRAMVQIMRSSDGKAGTFFGVVRSFGRERGL